MPPLNRTPAPRTLRLGTMLVTAAIVVPVLALAAVLVWRHFVFSHYDTHTLQLWLALDAAVLLAGVILLGEDSR